MPAGGKQTNSAVILWLSSHLSLKGSTIAASSEWAALTSHVPPICEVFELMQRSMIFCAVACPDIHSEGGVSSSSGETSNLKKEFSKLVSYNCHIICEF